jgi:hypothetical protein
MPARNAYNPSSTDSRACVASDVSGRGSVCNNSAAIITRVTAMAHCVDFEVDGSPNSSPATHYATEKWRELPSPGLSFRIMLSGSAVY